MRSKEVDEETRRALFPSNYPKIVSLMFRSPVSSNVHILSEFNDEIFEQNGPSSREAPAESVLAIAEAMLAKGALIVITGRRPDILGNASEKLRASGGHVDFVAADVSTEKGRATTLEFALEKLGGLDILVNNAGGVRAGRLEDTSEAEIRTMIEVDLVAPILLTRAALPNLRAQATDGLVVNITSGIALVAAPFYATYAGVKGGLAKFGESLRRELKGEGVHVMTVYPGATDTPMMRSSKAGPELGFTREPPPRSPMRLSQGSRKMPLRSFAAAKHAPR